MSADYYNNPQHGGAPTYGYPAPQPPPGYATIVLPPGWLSQFDIQAQRWFYINQATGGTTWESPNGGSHGGYQDASRGYGEPYSQGPGYNNNSGSGNYQGEPEKEKSDKSSMFLAAAGGLAVGAIGGALIANALGTLNQLTPLPNHFNNQTNPAEDDDDDEERRAAAAAELGADPDSGMPPPVLGAIDADGNSVSSSDRESVAEAREEYEEALAKAADSDASSSDQEELEEAHEEYIEEYEDTYGHDD
jgi:hypothetical protein